jgi:hypothetical protein
VTTPIKDRQHYVFLEPGDVAEVDDEMAIDDDHMDLEWIKITDPGTKISCLTGCLRRPVKD